MRFLALIFAVIATAFVIVTPTRQGRCDKSSALPWLGCWGAK